MIENAYSFSWEDIAERFQTDLKNGLDRNMVKKHYSSFGPNEIPQDQPKSRFKILIDQ